MFLQETILQKATIHHDNFYWTVPSKYLPLKMDISILLLTIDIINTVYSMVKRHQLGNKFIIVTTPHAINTNDPGQCGKLPENIFLLTIMNSNANKAKN